ncbi:MULTISPECIES: hypothetical protein [Thalassospira]|jgi:uncharacterized membrane protein|uniref:Intracellular septation protein A n=1 Tax=Thalassospira xiamenensis TaxID=220697 RepID=A0ABR5XYR1_9PROT|nr:MULTISPECIES: hypothetical protein [Thalassospira]MAL29133.1 hypothetical protein [Thalassospira sp.]MBR9780666.1 hypothetical protein [Rhodospirillales bacterium]KZC99554.1 hypothetical protein AUP40_03280 [Thalassospira xiamenensis]KZD06745.1 hypothetical protein AUP45_19630 [Thalassospira xiamenensis]MBR9815304.1 hypothetical protein [Rhodospirillales bacterium]|tara:strand:+ start:15475 stop:16062 length:588 start_codon:yes stop_codon:yes gene_type:complete
MSWSVPKRIAALLLGVLGVTYPVLVYFGLSAFSPQFILIGLLIVVLLRAVTFAVQKRYGPAGLAVLVAGIVAAGGLASELLAIRFYPVIVSLTMGAVFTVTLFTDRPMVERLARLKMPDLDDYSIAYTRKLTKVWIGFFAVNAMIATWTALYASMEIWTLYNGFLSYLLIGILFIGEWPVRRILRARHDRKIKES